LDLASGDALPSTPLPLLVTDLAIWGDLVVAAHPYVPLMTLDRSCQQ